MAALRCAAGATPSTAISFLRVAAARTSRTQALEFLIPSRSVQTQAYQTSPRPWIASRKDTEFPGPQVSRYFRTTTRRARTVVSHNPQKDDEGNEMSLDITPRAANRLREIMARDSNPDLALRIQVESGGCHGFQYLMSLVSAGPGAVREDDTVLSYADDDAGASSTDGVEASGPGRPKIVLDTPSLELLKGSKVDFTMELIGSQFKIVDNPLATSSCGCGTSFDIKV